MRRGTSLWRCGKYYDLWRCKSAKWWTIFLLKPYYDNISSEDLVAIKLISAINHTGNKPIGRAVALLRGRKYGACSAYCWAGDNCCKKHGLPLASEFILLYRKGEGVPYVYYWLSEDKFIYITWMKVSISNLCVKVHYTDGRKIDASRTAMNSYTHRKYCEVYVQVADMPFSFIAQLFCNIKVFGVVQRTRSGI